VEAGAVTINVACAELAFGAEAGSMETSGEDQMACASATSFPVSVHPTAAPGMAAHGSMEITTTGGGTVCGAGVADGFAASAAPGGRTTRTARMPDAA